VSELNAGEVRPEAMQTQELLEHRLAFEKLISAISTNFINVAAADVDCEISAALESVGRFVGADRSYIYMVSDDRQSAMLAYEWNADPNVIRGVDVKIPMSSFPWTRERISHLQQVMISIDDLPPEAVAEREAFRRAGNLRFFASPLRFARPLPACFRAGQLRQQSRCAHRR